MSTEQLPLGLTPETFDSHRHIQDDYADRVAEQIIANPHNQQVYRQLGKIQKNSDPVDIHIRELKSEIGHNDEEHEAFVQLLNNYFENTEFLDFRRKRWIRSERAVIFLQFMDPVPLLLWP